MSRRTYVVLRLCSHAPYVFIWLVATLAALFSLGGCHKETGSLQPPQAPVSVMKVEPRDTPVVIDFVGQTQSSHQVEIRARVNGFLDKRMYVEGSLVRAGEVMFRMDPKPFQTQLEAEQGALAQQQARLTTARANLKRVKPLVEQDALSQKDLDDATGQEQAAAAAVETAKANVEQAKLNLGYCTIASPVTGLSSYARVQDGAYVNVQNSLLTYVARTDPIWVNFSVSENDVLLYRGESGRGLLRLPAEGNYIVEAVLADGSVFPYRGHLTFADAEYNTQTGTFLVRGSLANPGSILRPGQFVRVRLLGAVRPQAILVPQRAVLEGAQGHFVWIVDKEGKAQVRNVEAGPWHGDQWFIVKGLKSGDVVVVDGMIKLASGLPVKALEVTPKGESGAAAQSAGTAPDSGQMTGKEAKK